MANEIKWNYDLKRMSDFERNKFEEANEACDFQFPTEPNDPFDASTLYTLLASSALPLNGQ
jgi:hypothetical protein